MPSYKYLEGLHILAVDDEPDVLESIQDILDKCQIDTATDYESASEKLNKVSYDLVILDIMGVEGMTLLDEAVQRQIPAVMLTAHGISPEMLQNSFQKGAICYIPKEELANLDQLLDELLQTIRKGQPPWKLFLKRLGDFFAKRFGPDWDALEEEIKKDDKPILFY